MTPWVNCRCSVCKTPHWTILETRRVPEYTGVTRRRHLCHNGHRFTTYTNDENGCVLPARPPRIRPNRKRKA